MFTNTNWAVKILGYGFLAIVALLPFHAFLSTWAISNFGLETLFKGWKELLLLGVLLPVGIYVVAQKPLILKTIWRRRLNKLVFGYVALTLLLALFADNGLQATAVGLVFNLRFFAMFILAQVLLELLPQEKLRAVTLKIVFATGLVVVAFGLLQVLVLPNDFLRHFGYSKDIIPPYFTIDNNENLVRILSTLRGPNILGAYLVIWLPILLVITKKVWRRSRNWQLWLGLVWAASLVTLYGSQSRSAFGAVVISLGIFMLVSLPKKLRIHAITAIVVCVASFSVVVGVNWDSNFVQYRLLHRDPAEAIAVDSDDQRIGSLQAAWQDVLAHPFGQGPGTAGLASTYGNNPKITENYYLQIGQEVGLIGMLLFIAIIFFAASLLIEKSKPWNVELALLSSLIGLSLIAFVQPVWGDETVSMLWWSLAGLYLWQHTKKQKLPNK